MVISAILNIRAEYSGPRRDVYIFKPLTMICIILIALRATDPPSALYKYLIICGLFCSLIGDVFLMLPSDRFVHGLISFLAAHLFYIAAFSYEGGRAFSAWQAIPFLIYGGLMLRILLPSLGKMKLPVMLYMLAILIMGWRALSRMLETQAEGSALALLGALMFIASDSILALDWFKGHFHSAPFLILSTYFIAQWLIALSI